MTETDKERARILAILSAHDLANAGFAHRLGKAHPEAQRCRDACDLIRELEDDIRSGITADELQEKLSKRAG